MNMALRWLAAGAALALAAGCGRAAAGPAGRLYVTNEASGDISVIDTRAARVVATLPLGKRPRGIRIGPDGRTAFVALSGSPFAGPEAEKENLPPPDRAADGIAVVDLAALRVVKILPSG